MPPIIRRNGNKFLDYVNPKRQRKKVIKGLKSSKLFGGDDSLFKSLLAQTDFYVEVGCGQSTVYALENYKLKGVVAIDSSKEWLQIVNEVASNEVLITHHSDFGPLGRWGRPQSYSKIDAVLNYSSAIFKYFEPDLILIDGRFRVYCFLYACLFGQPGLKILFDDYHGRDHYRIVERFIKPVESCGRQALFILDTEFDKKGAEVMLKKFEFVMD